MTSPLKRAGMIVGFLLAAIGVFFAASIAAPQASIAAEGTPHWLLQLKDGTVDIELLPTIAPKHVERIIALTEKGFYDGIVFHRVIDGFMAQSGDPTGTGMGGSDMPDVKAEFTNQMSFQRGILGAARSDDPDTFNSQFFITFGDASFLDGQYTIFGKVVSGMEFVDNITRGEPPANPDKIISAKIEYR
jgi:peptidylprolyl isomerase